MYACKRRCATKRPHTKTLMVFEEVLPLESDEASALKLKDGNRDYGLIAQLYQQLKKNYDERLDYWLQTTFTSARWR
jgi:hypothetical protein